MWKCSSLFIEEKFIFSQLWVIVPLPVQGRVCVARGLWLWLLPLDLLPLSLSMCPSLCDSTSSSGAL